ncbi:MAG: hypothetical protein Q8R32_00765 [bacterium]|nr:hypothetical protein [bacterium]
MEVRMMKRMFATAAMSAATCLVLVSTAFGQTTSAAASTPTECKKSDECSDPTPICDVAKVCRARTPAEDAAKIRKDKQDVEKANVEDAKEKLADANTACSRDGDNCGTPVKDAEARLAAAKQEAQKVGAGAATVVAGTCYDTHVSQCSTEPIRGTCAGSSQILRCAGVLAEINLQPRDSGVSSYQIGRIESRLNDHERRINGVEGTQAALMDEADRTGTRADAAYAAAVEEPRDEAEANASADVPPAGGSAGEVDTDKLSGCIGAKARFLKRDKRLATDAARHNAASSWCLASLNK